MREKLGIFVWKVFVRKIYMYLSIVFPVGQLSPYSNLVFKLFVVLEVWDFSIDRCRAFEIWILELPPAGPKYWQSFVGRGGGKSKVLIDQPIRDLWWSLFLRSNTWPAWSFPLCRSKTFRTRFLHVLLFMNTQKCIVDYEQLPHQLRKPFPPLRST